MYTHYGPMFSYYSAKTRAFLNYKRLPYSEIYDQERFREYVVKKVGRTAFPIIENENGEIIQDTTVIIDLLESRHPERPVFPEDPVLMLITRIVEFFIDEFWVVTAMNSRWNDVDAARFASSEFVNFYGVTKGGDVWSDGEKVAKKMSGYRRVLDIFDPSGQKLVQQLFEEATALLNKAVGPRQFALGQRLSLIDCCLHQGYFAHQYRDQGATQRYLKTEASSLCYFLDNMQAAGGAPDVGDLAVTDALLNYLRFIGPIAAAYADNIRSIAQPVLAMQRSGESVNELLYPQIEIFGQPYKRVSSTFSAWKVQRVQEAYDRLKGDDLKRGNDLTQIIGWKNFFKSTYPTIRLARVGFELQLKG